MRILFVLLLIASSIFSCKKDTGVITPYEDYVVSLDLGGTLPPPNLPTDNLLTNSKVELGRYLFYEKMLSGNNQMSCASCHNQQTAFADTAQFSTGIDGLLGHRQAMSIVNMAWNSNNFFWDGRANLLRDQSLKPISDPLEMHENLDYALIELKASLFYKTMFQRAFADGKINSLNLSLALEAFMNTIVSSNSRYDQYLRGEVTFTDSEIRGKYLFFTEYNPGFPATSGADCVHCHSGKNFENDMYFNNGLDLEANFTDLGRFNVTNLNSDRATFKVPTLRNIELTPPYMHDGRYQTLEQVIDHYNSGIQTSSTAHPALIYTINWIDVR
jgi:cytochrome c peroxidase